MNNLIRSLLRGDQLSDLSHLLCLSLDCRAEAFLIQKLSFVPEDYRGLPIWQPLTRFTSLNNSLIFFCLPEKNANNQHLCVNLGYSSIWNHREDRNLLSSQISGVPLKLVRYRDVRKLPGSSRNAVKKITNVNHEECMEKKDNHSYINIVQIWPSAWNSWESWWGRTARETFFPSFGKSDADRNFIPNWWVQRDTKSSLFALENIFSCWWDECLISCVEWLRD